MSKQYEVEVYYSGFVTRRVEAASECEAHAIATKEATRLIDKQDSKFTADFMSSLLPWPEADTTMEIKNGNT